VFSTGDLLARETSIRELPAHVQRLLNIASRGDRIQGVKLVVQCEPLLREEILNLETV
jgi:hypothetical protein